MTERQALTIYPAIDLKGGVCVRLYQGRMEEATVYNPDPADQAAAFAKAGFSHLHIVDLDGAFAGKSENSAAVEAILKASPAKAQLGGGVRDMAAVEGWFAKGLARVILGTAAVRDPAFVKAAAHAFPGRIAIGIDALAGDVMTDGWAGEAGAAALDIARRYEDAGIAAVIYTDIARDGALTGVNIEATAKLAEALSIPVIASGGVAEEGDITALAAAPAGIDGVIIGRAFYDARLTPEAALEAARR